MLLLILLLACLTIQAKDGAHKKRAYRHPRQHTTRQVDKQRTSLSPQGDSTQPNFGVGTQEGGIEFTQTKGVTRTRKRSHVYDTMRFQSLPIVSPDDKSGQYPPFDVDLLRGIPLMHPRWRWNQLDYPGRLYSGQLEDIAGLPYSRPGGYVGCFTDRLGEPQFKEGPMRPGFTVSSCSIACKGYIFMALKDTGNCSCARSFYPVDKYPQVDDGECGAACGAGPCGGPMANAVYFVNQNCKDMLGVEEGGALQSSAFKASSYFNLAHHPSFGRLRHLGPPWCAHDRGEEWLQVDLGKAVLIFTVMTQGSEEAHVPRWTTTYELRLSTDGISFTALPEVFFANNDTRTVVRRALSMPSTARYVRIYPRSWRPADEPPCIRFALQGCPSSAGYD